MATFPNTYIPTGTLSTERMNRFVDEYLTPKLLMFRQITVADEIMTLDYDRLTWRLAWGNVLSEAPFKVIRAGERMMPSTYELNPEYGTLTFDDVGSDFKMHVNSGTIDTVGADGVPLIEVSASYTFDYFPANVLQNMVVNSCNVVNTAGDQASPTAYTPDNCPDYWDGVITDLAFAMCIERLLLDYDLWKGRLIFAIGADMILEGNGGDITGQLTSLKQNAEERAYKTLDNPRFKAGGYVLSLPTGNYYRAINTIGTIGSQNMQLGGRLRGWRINRLGR